MDCHSIHIRLFSWNQWPPVHANIISHNCLERFAYGGQGHGHSLVFRFLGPFQTTATNLKECRVQLLFLEYTGVSRVGTGICLHFWLPQSTSIDITDICKKKKMSGAAGYSASMAPLERTCLIRHWSSLVSLSPLEYSLIHFPSVSIHSFTGAIFYNSEYVACIVVSSTGVPVILHVFTSQDLQHTSKEH